MLLTNKRYPTQAVQNFVRKHYLGTRDANIAIIFKETAIINIKLFESTKAIAAFNKQAKQDFRIVSERGKRV